MIAQCPYVFQLLFSKTSAWIVARKYLGLRRKDNIKDILIYVTRFDVRSV